MTRNKFKFRPAASGVNLIMDIDDDMFISFNPSPCSDVGISAFRSDDGGAETAIVMPNEKPKYLILNGDWRKEFVKVAPDGKEAIIKVFDGLKEKHRSSWSEDIDIKDFALSFLSKLQKGGSVNKTKKDFLENHCDCPELARKVFNQMGASWQEIKENPMDYRGASGGISGFIYYTETEPFAKRNIELILETLNEFEESTGNRLGKDNDNLLNWYAWFALEHVIQQVIDYMEEG